MKSEKYLSKLSDTHYKQEAINVTHIAQILVVETLKRWVKSEKEVEMWLDKV